MRVTFSDMDFEDKKVRYWLTRNRGVLTRVAVHCGVTPQFVQQIAYGKSSAKAAAIPIEHELRRQGWPGHKREESNGKKEN